MWLEAASISWWPAPVAPTLLENQLTNVNVYLATLTTRSSLCCSVLPNSLRKYLSEECGNRFIESPKPEVSFLTRGASASEGEQATPQK